MNYKVLLAAGGIMSIGSLLFYELKLKAKCKFQDIKILSEKKILEIFHQIKVKYRDAFKKHQKIFRNGRRKLQRNSAEYANFVYDSYSNLQKIFNDSVEEVLSENGITKETYENSWRILKNDDIVNEAAEDMKVISVTGNLRNDLSFDMIRDALEYCKEKLDNELGSIESLQLAVCMLEDDLKEMYGSEIEEFEKAYYAHVDNFDDYDSVFQAVKEAKSVIQL